MKDKDTKEKGILENRTPEQKDEMLISAMGLIRHIHMYGRMNHTNPKDYKELCETFAKEWGINL